MSLALRPVEPPALPVRDRRQRRHILVRHPGYDDSNNVLLKLYASDVGSSRPGLYAQFVLDACGIVVGNRWDGWLSETSVPNEGEGIDSSSVLERESYYFHLPTSQGDTSGHARSHPYPVVPTFREWRFPHGHLPPPWRQIATEADSPAVFEQSFATSNLNLALQNRDASCRVSGCREGTQVAHICPQKEAEWWFKNAMSRYNVGRENTPDDLANALLLRADLHIAFDKPKFVFVPKPSISGSPQIVIHVLESSAELEHLYHNRALQTLYSSVELAFARFAWSIFPYLDTFLTCRERRRLLLSYEDVALFDTDGFVSWDKCVEFSRRRSRSPKKRKPEAEPIPTANNTMGYALSRKRRQRSTLDAMASEKAHNGDVELKEWGALCGHDHFPCSSLETSSTSKSSSSPTIGRSIKNQSQELARTVLPTCNKSTHFLQQRLAQERARSDPSGEWERERLWAENVWTESTTLDEWTARRWLRSCGVEFLDDPGDNIPA